MESNMVGSSVAECDDHMAGGDGAPDNGGSSGPERFPTCNWATDWALQSNDTYLWVGLPPGSSGCNNVGQDGELLARLRSGAKLTLVVEIGDNPVGIDICSGRFSATTVSDGQTCASDNPSVWPQVTGTLVVEDSTGFLVGTGQ